MYKTHFAHNEINRHCFHFHAVHTCLVINMSSHQNKTLNLLLLLLNSEHFNIARLLSVVNYITAGFRNLLI